MPMSLAWSAPNPGVAWADRIDRGQTRPHRPHGQVGSGRSPVIVIPRPLETGRMHQWSRLGGVPPVSRAISARGIPNRRLPHRSVAVMNGSPRLVNGPRFHLEA